MFKENISNLFALQKIDSRLQYIEKSKGGLPEAVNNIQADLDAKEDRYSLLCKENEDLQNEKEKLQDEIVSVSQNVERYQEQKKQVTTNKEYEAIVSQIQFAEEQIENSEVRIEEIELVLSENKEEIAQIEESKVEIVVDLTKNRELLDKKLSETEQEESELKSTKEELVASLPVRVYALYEKIRNSKNGIAVVNGDKGHCEGCHTMLPWQKISELKRQNQIVQCEACSRILTYHLDQVDEEGK